jgi:hypothetical protein
MDIRGRNRLIDCWAQSFGPPVRQMEDAIVSRAKLYFSLSEYAGSDGKQVE